MEELKRLIELHAAAHKRAMDHQQAGPAYEEDWDNEFLLSNAVDAQAKKIGVRLRGYVNAEVILP
jgi:hypothetical protein